MSNFIGIVSHQQELATIGVLVILYHSIMRPANDGPRAKRSAHIALFTFLFEFIACAAILYWFGLNMFTGIIVAYSVITWIPFFIINIVVLMKPRKLKKTGIQ
jgi:hypothetical protein